MNDKTIRLLEIVVAESSRLKPGESITVTCPDCGKQMTISKHKQNHHIWVTCPQCGVKLSS